MPHKGILEPTGFPKKTIIGLITAVHRAETSSKEKIRIQKEIDTGGKHGELPLTLGESIRVEHIIDGQRIALPGRIIHDTRKTKIQWPKIH